MKDNKKQQPDPSLTLRTSPKEKDGTGQEPQRPNPEVLPLAKRRRFSAKYKMDILKQAESCTQPGDLGSLLRREGLYHSNLTTWKRQKEDGTIQGLTPKKRGPQPSPDKTLVKRIAQLEKENQYLADKLNKAELIIEVQKKVSRLLEEMGANA